MHAFVRMPAHYYTYILRLARPTALAWDGTTLGKLIRLRLRLFGYVVVVVVVKLLFKYIDWPGGQSTLGPLLRAARPGHPTRLYCRLICPQGVISRGRK